jgi:hypothetical protein
MVFRLPFFVDNSLEQLAMTVRPEKSGGLTFPFPRKCHQRINVVRPISQSCWIEVRSTRPNKRVNLWIDLDLVEQSQITKRPEQLARENGAEIDNLFGSIIKSDGQHVVADNPKTADAINWMMHSRSLQWGDRKRGLAPLQTLPISQQFLMQLGPRQDQTTLSPRQVAGNDFDRILHSVPPG